MKLYSITYVLLKFFKSEFSQILNSQDSYKNYAFNITNSMSTANHYGAKSTGVLSIACLCW
jgi:hypothetical protein